MNNFSRFIKNFTNDSIRHITYNASQSEVYLRHPSGPLGLTLRDQGQVDLYAGRTRFIMTLSGEVVSIAKAWALFSDSINFAPKDITRFRINGRHFNSDIFKGQKIAALKSPGALKGIFVLNAATKWNEETKQFIGLVPLTSVLEEKTIFDTDNDQHLPSSTIEHFNTVKKMIGEPRSLVATQKFGTGYVPVT